MIIQSFPSRLIVILFLASYCGLLFFVAMLFFLIRIIISLTVFKQSFTALDLKQRSVVTK